MAKNKPNKPPNQSFYKDALVPDTQLLKISRGHAMGTVGRLLVSGVGGHVLALPHDAKIWFLIRVRWCPFAVRRILARKQGSDEKQCREHGPKLGR
jgi:hypothetical protein